MKAKILTVSMPQLPPLFCYFLLLLQTLRLSYVDIRKQEEVLQESYMMIPDSKSRLEKVISELITIIVSQLLF